MSDAAAAGNGQQGQAAQGGEGEAQQQGQGFDASGIASQLEALSSGQEELRQFLNAQPWSQQEVQQVQDADPALDLSFLEQVASAGVKVRVIEGQKTVQPLQIR